MIDRLAPPPGYRYLDGGENYHHRYSGSGGFWVRKKEDEMERSTEMDDERAERVLALVQDAAGDEDRFREGMIDIAEREVDECLESLAMLGTAYEWKTLACIARRLSVSAALLAEETPNGWRPPGGRRGRWEPA